MGNSNPLFDDEGAGDLEDNPKRVRISDRWEGFEPGPLPLAPDGGIEGDPSSQDTDALPQATPETFVCLRGPCRFYLEFTSYVNAVAPDGKQHAYIHRHCSVLPGVEFESTDSVIYTCNRWEPIPVTTLVRRTLLRAPFSLAKSLRDLLKTNR